MCGSYADLFSETVVTVYKCSVNTVVNPNPSTDTVSRDNTYGSVLRHPLFHLSVRRRF
jgi:hypothetical protein